jgi:hypothetical protein
MDERLRVEWTAAYSTRETYEEGSVTGGALTGARGGGAACVRACVRACVHAYRYGDADPVKALLWPLDRVPLHAPEHCRPAGLVH